MKFEPKEIARQLREEYQDETDTEADALMLDAATCIEELSSAFSETVNQRDAALALLREAQEVLADHWFTSVMDGDYGEDFNNEDVIAMDDKIKKFLPEAPK